MLFSEPKIPQLNKLDVVAEHYPSFQCSSASRKFLNTRPARTALRRSRLFQCSSASRKFLNAREQSAGRRVFGVSVLFSEPKIPQLNARTITLEQYVAGFSALQRAENSSTPAKLGLDNRRELVSVLFSEPKIPQRLAQTATGLRCSPPFQCSSASRKFLNERVRRTGR